MFKHILLSTDGSPLSEAVIKPGSCLAKSFGAKVTGLCVMPIQPIFFYETEIAYVRMEAIEQKEKRCSELAETYLVAIEKVAKKAGVACGVVYEKNDSPYEAIIRIAKQKGCDFIMMASHGRKGVGAILLGSETPKVLTHSKIPVLVYR